ncbi:MAG: quinone-dependent dihydroorotate dehydrogenase [Bacteroidales bacterium]|nr:quinone-dependent dihydroorotate dehydrogenase [Bacteroidales bacterium]
MFYKSVIRPLLFRFAPEFIHHFVFVSLKIFFSIPGLSGLLRSYCLPDHKSLKKELLGIKFDSPVGIAAGFDKNAQLYKQMFSLGFGFIEVGTVTPEGQIGNPKPRLFRLPSDKALINRMGFNNAGYKAAVQRLSHRNPKEPVGGNLGKNTCTLNNVAVEDYALLFEELFNSVDYFVVNVSCPNISDLKELQDQKALVEILESLQSINNNKPKRKPVLLKISPDLNNKQLDEVIQIVDQTKIDGVVAVNTTITRNNLKAASSKIKLIGNGGLSGKPLQKRALEVVRYLSEKSNKSFPIIGVGGIFTPDDALAMLEAGADLIQVYTGFIYEGPFIARRINKAIIKNSLSKL